MKSGTLLGAALLFLGATTLPAQESASQKVAPRVALETSQGRIVVELYPEKAPRSVENFLAYVDAGYYADTIFHRVIPEFMIQGGGFTADLEKKATRDPIPNEADNGLSNERGTVAMARTADPQSATSQFYLNLANNRPLDHRSKDPRGWGYAVFGRVVEGMSVVDAIAGVPTTTRPPYRDVPVEPVMILGASRVTEPAAE